MHELQATGRPGGSTDGGGGAGAAYNLHVANVAALGDVWFSLYLVGIVVSTEKHLENDMFCLLPEGSRGALQVCSQELNFFVLTNSATKTRSS